MVDNQPLVDGVKRPSTTFGLVGCVFHVIYVILLGCSLVFLFGFVADENCYHHPGINNGIKIQVANADHHDDDSCSNVWSLVLDWMFGFVISTLLTWQASNLVLLLKTVEKNTPRTDSIKCMGTYMATQIVHLFLEVVLMIVTVCLLLFTDGDVSEAVYWKILIFTIPVHGICMLVISKYQKKLQIWYDAVIAAAANHVSDDLKV